MSGQRYSTTQLNSFKPPSFLDKAPKQKKKTILSIEITIGKNKTSVINLKEGDIAKDVANNFCKAYGLDK